MNNNYNIKNLHANGMEEPYFLLNRPKGVDSYLLLLFKSQGELTINKIKFAYGPNDIVILKPNTPHIINTLNNPLIHDWIHFTISGRPFSFPDFNFNVLFHCSFANVIADFVKYLQTEFLSQYCDQEILNNLMNAIISYVVRSYSIVKRFSPSELITMARFNELRNAIYADCTNAKSIKEMATDLYLSESRFSHIYKKLYNISPKQDILNAKIQTAKSLLLATDNSVKEISEKCGFSSEYVFIRRFKQKVGITPLKWKQ